MNGKTVHFPGIAAVFFLVLFSCTSAFAGSTRNITVGGYLFSINVKYNYKAVEYYANKCFSQRVSQAKADAAVRGIAYACVSEALSGNTFGSEPRSLPSGVYKSRPGKSSSYYFPVK